VSARQGARESRAQGWEGEYWGEAHSQQHQSRLAHLRASREEVVLCLAVVAALRVLRLGAVACKVIVLVAVVAPAASSRRPRYSCPRGGRAGATCAPGTGNCGNVVGWGEEGRKGREHVRKSDRQTSYLSSGRCGWTILSPILIEAQTHEYARMLCTHMYALARTCIALWPGDGSGLEALCAGGHRELNLLRDMCVGERVCVSE
jgi:hypothetical protein